MLKLVNHKGDTIVEVMISLAVLSLAFAISYATASHALRDSQSAQEHSLAVDYVDQQLEALHFVASQEGQTAIPGAVFSGADTTPFCLYANGGNISYVANPLPPSTPNSQCEQSGNGFNYVTYDVPVVENTPFISQVNFQVTVAWPGLGNLGKECSLPGLNNVGEQCEQLAYRVYAQ